jgi:hypothetical protein
VRPLVTWSCRLAALVLVVGLVFSPLRASAAPVPVLAVTVAVIGPTSTTYIERIDAVRGPTGEAHSLVYDEARDAYDYSIKLSTTDIPRTTVRRAREYDGALERADWRALQTEGRFCDTPAVVLAAEARTT